MSHLANLKEEDVEVRLLTESELAKVPNIRRCEEKNKRCTYKQIQEEFRDYR